MAKVDTNKVVAALRGALGGLVLRQMPDGSVVISTVLDEDRAAGWRLVGICPQHALDDTHRRRLGPGRE